MDLKDYRTHIAFVVISAMAIYIPSFRGGFGWDEFNMFFGNSYFIRIPEFDFHRPLFRSLLLLERALFGDHAVYYHIINSLIHTANAVMVLIIARRLLANVTAAFISALVFALHPLNSEAVAWVFGVSDMLMTFLSLVSFLLYLLYREDGKLTALIASALFFLLACLSGQGALVLPFVVLVYEIMLGDGIKGFKLPAIAYVVALAVYLISFRGIGEIITSDAYAFGRIYDSLAAMGYYIYKLLIPIDLSFMPLMHNEHLYLIFAFVILVSAFMFRSEKRKLEFFLLSFMIIMMLPTLAHILVESKTHIEFRHMYASSVVFAMFMGLMLSRVPGRRIMVALVVVVSLLYAGLALDRAVVWNDRTLLWAEAYESDPYDEVRNINYVAALMHEDRNAEAKPVLRKALALAGLSSEGFQAMMTMLYDISPDSDEEMYKLLADIKGPSRANLGMGFMYYSKYARGDRKDRGLLMQSVKYLENSVNADTGLIMARYYLGVAYLEVGQFDKSIEELMSVQTMDPSGRYAKEATSYLDMAIKFKEMYSKQLKIDLK